MNYSTAFVCYGLRLYRSRRPQILFVVVDWTLHCVVTVRYCYCYKFVPVLAFWVAFFKDYFNELILVHEYNSL